MKIWQWVAAAVAAIAPIAGADPAMHGRISYDSGNTLVRGEGGGDWAYATTNTLILPGDTLWIDQGGLGEAELPQGTFLRLADSSKVEVTSLDPTIAMRGWEGSFYVQRLTRSPGQALFETPAGTLSIDPDTQVRVDILADGSTTVTVRWGRVDVRTHGGSVSVLAGRRTWIDAGLLPATPVNFDRSVEDDFDTWSRERAEYLVRGAAQTPAEVTVAPATLGVSDLNHYGEWVYVESRPYWRPTVVVDYVPYRTGYWNYVNGTGHVWVGTQPFSYVTSHYGRWSYQTNYGWLWSYDPVWSPAWVVGVRYGDYYAWTPCDYYYRPVLTSSSSYFNIGGVQFSVHSTSYVPYNHLYGGPRYISAYDSHVFAPYQQPGVNVNINIWNINTGGNRGDGPRGPRHPFDSNVFTERDYSPNRSIRGVQQLDADSYSAVERANRLEQSAGRRGQFAAESRVQRDGQTRTSYRDGERAAEVRTVRAERGNPATFENALSRGEGRTINNRSLREDNAPSDRTERGPEARDRGTIEGRSVTRTETPDTPRVSTPRSERATIEAPQRTEPRTSRGEGDSNSSIRRTEPSGEGRGNAVQTPSRSIERPQARSVERTQPRSVSQTPTRTIGQPPTRGAEQTPQRQNTTIRDSSGTRSVQQSPQRSEVREYNAPAERSAPRSVQQAPQRSEVREYSAPAQRSVNRPSVERSAPVQRPSYTAPQQVRQPSAPERSFEPAPRSSAREFSAPQQRQQDVAPQRSYSRPSEPSISAPSRGDSVRGDEPRPQGRSSVVRGGR